MKCEIWARSRIVNGSYMCRHPAILAPLRGWLALCCKKGEISNAFHATTWTTYLVAEVDETRHLILSDFDFLAAKGSEGDVYRSKSIEVGHGE